uniref:Histidine kinase n=1 Tax=Roseihalotalea indica TaxID=2867963 RepID=A0AA49GK55_9BACT|nr:histidine kinase [Tunicatimonas sp. TK19036]
MVSYSVIDKYRKQYYGWRRFLVHVLFWLVIFCFELIQSSITIEDPSIRFFFTLREVATIATIHYFLAYYAIPRFLLKRKWLPFIFCIILSYVSLMAGEYYSLYFLTQNHLVTGYLVQTASFFLKYDFLTTLVDPARMYNIFGFNLSLAFSLLIKLTMNIYKSNLQKLSLEKEKVELKKKKTELELAFLKAQINPHFFFNTLNNVYSLIVDKDEFAASVVLKLSDMMRYTLYEATNDKILLSRELQFIQDYAKLEKIRHKDHVVIQTNIQAVPSHLKIPPLILVTFVENAFKHGINNTIAASWVIITASLQESTLTYTVENSKPSSLRQETIQGGIGLVNVRRRLDILYADRYELTVKNEPSTYAIHLTIQLHEDITQLHNHRRRTVRPRPNQKIH